MIISVINHTNGDIADADVHTVLRAVNRQIACDFQPYWSLGATLRLEGRSQQRRPRRPSSTCAATRSSICGTGRTSTTPSATTTRTTGASRSGSCSPRFAEELGEPWSVTLSHEALELIGDPEANLLAAGDRIPPTLTPTCSTRY